MFLLYRRIHLSGAALEWVRRRALTVALFAWLPLLALTTWEGTQWRGPREPFLLDFNVHVRLLFALPMLLAGEFLAHRRMGRVVAEFITRDMIPPNHLARFTQALQSAQQWRNSASAEAALLALVYGLGVAVMWRSMAALRPDTWYHHSMAATGNEHMTLAGWWYVLVSLPLFQFILFRWYFRILIWARLLFQIARIPLQLIATHPDRCGGLGFLGEFLCSFIPLLVAHGALLAGTAASGILLEGRALPDYAPELIVLTAIVALLVCGPLLAFIPVLVRLRRVGLATYGTLAQQYVRDFEHKWLRGAAPTNETLLGSSDIQSLADLSNSFQIVADMRILPLSAAQAVRLCMITLAPLVPLLFTVVSPRELAEVLLKSVA